MKMYICSCVYITLGYLFFLVTATSGTPKDPYKSYWSSSAEKGLFDSDEVLGITLSGNIRQVFNDRSENPQYHPIFFLYKENELTEISIPAEVKTRGHFRKMSENCTYPPLLIHFSKSDIVSSSIFKKQDKCKLVMPCRGDEYVIREWLVYKLYNLVTPKSFRSRLVSVRLDDIKNKKAATPFYGILLEEQHQMAKRNGTISIDKKIKPEQAEPDAFLTMAVFEYLIGNTDWSVQYLQNIKLLAADSNAVPTAVPYDFDHAGLVNAPYAKPAEELLMNSVRERRYRGFCVQDMKKFDKVIALYNRLKNDIYNLYANCSLLDAKYIKATLKYFDEFYVTINNMTAMQKEFRYPCDKYGTGNIVIKGLKKD